MKLFFDEVGCDWGFEAEIYIDPADDTGDAQRAAIREMVAELNAGLQALSATPLTRVGVIICE